MPILTHSFPKYRKHQSGQAVVSVAGKDHYLGPHGTKASKLLYDRIILEWLASGRPSTHAPAQEEVTVKEILAKWLIHAERHYRRDGEPTGTAANYHSIMTLTRQLYGNTSVSEFGPLALKALMVRMVQGGASRRYVNDNIQRLRKIFRWAASEQLISVSVVQSLATVSCLEKGRSEAREPDPIEPVPEATVELTLPHLSPVVQDMVRIQQLTGARPGEICAMRPKDIDRSGDVWIYRLANHKTSHKGKRRVIYIGPEGQKILASYLLREESSHCFSPRESEKKRLNARQLERVTPLSCGNRPGTNNRGSRKKSLNDRYTKTSYRRAVVRACEQAFGMPKHLRVLPKSATEEQRREASEWRAANCWSPNQLRHLAATKIRHRYGLEAAQVTLGHSRMDITQVYAEKNELLAAKVAMEIG